MNPKTAQMLRTNMVDCQIRTTDVTNLDVLEAFLTVPREAFVPASRVDLAYMDEEIAITDKSADFPRYMLAPSPLAKLVQLAKVKKDDVVLNIGCGVGYAAAILAKLASSVITVESDAGLAEKARANLIELSVDNAVVVTGPLEDGWASEAPYDVILLNGSVDEVPAKIFGQLRDGGHLIAVIGAGNAAKAMIYTKSGTSISGRDVFNTSIPALPGFAKIPEFEF